MYFTAVMIEPLYAMETNILAQFFYRWFIEGLSLWYDSVKPVFCLKKFSTCFAGGSYTILYFTLFFVFVTE